MGRLFSFFCVLMLATPGFAEAPALLRVLTYNIRHGEGTDRRFDLERVARVIERLRPDLVALQEVDVDTERSGRVDQLAELARLTGMHAEFGKAIDYEGGDYGVAILSRWSLSDVASYPLPGAPDRERRTALTVRVRPFVNGPVLQFTSTHLDQGGQAENRLAQAVRLNELMALGDGPAILAGDMNARRDTDVMQALEAEWLNASIADRAPAPPEGRPRSRGDHILVRPASSWRVVEWNAIDETVASDHRPVLAVVEWTAAR